MTNFFIESPPFIHYIRFYKPIPHLIRTQPKFIYKGDYPIDILPFGGIADEGMIAWPPEHDPKVTVTGFQEMFEHSDTHEIADALSIKVASLAGLTIVKLISWHDRSSVTGKDGEDLALILKEYADAGNLDRLYESSDNDIITSCDYDLVKASAQLLGRDIKNLAADSTLQLLLQIVDFELSSEEELLLQTMSTQYGNNFEKSREALSSFRLGLSTEASTKGVISE